MSKVQSISTNKIVTQAEGNIVSDMDGEKVMLNIQNGKYYNLGELGGEIWEQIKDPISVAELVTNLQSQYEVETSQCEKQVISFLNQLSAEGLITIK